MTSPFAGATKPGIGIYDLAFDSDGALWMLDESGLATHRRGQKKPEVVCGPEGGGAYGLAVAPGLVLTSSLTGATLRASDGAELQRYALEPSGVGLSPDGARVAIGHGYAGGSGQHVAVFDRAGALTAKVEDDAIRNDSGAFCFAADGSSLAFVARGALLVADVASGALVSRAPFRDGFQVSAPRMEPLGDRVLAVFAGRGLQYAISAAILDLDGRALWLGESADAVAANAVSGLVAVVKGAEVEVRNTLGEKLRSVARAKASFTVDAAAVSDDGWLALACGSKSGARAKSVEFVNLR